ncbi:excinuclease Cho [Chimaeribacter arupi]|uniref:Excinuclease cho n=2 Tax=Yersiniaceae TaxID=1903411 RepID=A0A2N5ER08_9GAMM|nr:MULTISPECIES: excinuclease Cho [Yersiniaceae]MBS0970933.1 excinuclease Cho [Nissabacter archeti]MDV5139130.1 excinuclease Cho [Chimaeribacter arupi]PLR36671.1 excinuclease Cho [Chimaeribacter arupi]PLR43200.1 excinuclease Cho [Chimaeribacter arupi]PLR48544.1 excinuclease Cho [Chimaeribacter arupi]
MARRASTHRLEFEPAAIYQYPEHLRDSLDALPKCPGVYVFHGDSDVMPLYIGKSVNIRSRVLSHLRTVEEARMLRQSRHITFIPTAGEVGALLLEAQMIKQQQPLHNKRLRHNRQLCSLQVLDGKPTVVYAKEIDFSHAPGLYGLYSSRRAAQQTLLTLADNHKLCHGLLGLEATRAGRACFRASLGRCAGACCGKETVEAHNQRLLDALASVQVVCWPYQGAIALVEERPGMKQYHIIHNWFYLGSVEDLADAPRLKATAKSFDSDGYKILCGPIIRGKLPIVEL